VNPSRWYIWSPDKAASALIRTGVPSAFSCMTPILHVSSQCSSKILVGGGFSKFIDSYDGGGSGIPEANV
jgi:hypothetical protein